MFFSKKNIDDKNDNFIKISALLIHAAKIDENYSLKEEEIIRKTLLEIGANSDDLNKIIEKGKQAEENSNQILTFTKEVKSMEEKKRLKLLKPYGPSFIQIMKLIYMKQD